MIVEPHVINVDKFKAGERVLVRGTFCYGLGEIAVVATKRTGRLHLSLDEVELDTIRQPLAVGDLVRRATIVGKLVAIEGEWAFVSWPNEFYPKIPLDALERA